MSPSVMLLSLLLLFMPLAHAQSSTPSSMSISMSDMPMSTAVSTSISPEYTITVLPAVTSQPSCIFNCLIPIGLADPSGCDDVTNDCACLSAPADALEALTGCIKTVCQSSTSACMAIATSLYESYCNSVYGTAIFASAFQAEASAAAASSSSASAEATTSMGSATVGTSTSTPASAAASATGKSESVLWSPSL